MALFNCLSLVLSLQVFIENRQHQQPATRAATGPSTRTYLSSLKLLNGRNRILPYQSQRKLVLAAESIYRFSKSQRENPGLINNLMHKYWEHIIFLSVSNPVSHTYIEQLTKQESLISKQRKRKLLIAFSKALLNGHIDANTIISQDYADKPYPSYIKYKWRKGVNLEFLKNINGIFKSSRKLHRITPIQHNLLQQLKNNQMPLFVVTNCFKQLVISEPTSPGIQKRSLNDNLSQWYYSNFFPNRNSYVRYESWFFVNPRDANEYKEHIINQYSRSAKQHRLITISSGIDFFYFLNRDKSAKVEFRLFPDLAEVGKLITDNQHRQNLVFDKKQNYGRSYFQGQPIYFIEPVICSIKNSFEKASLNYYYSIPGKTNNEKYNAIFLNKDTALRAWQHFRQEMGEYDLPSKPVLRVYNLEDFLKDTESNNQISNRNFLLIPGHESYYSMQKKYLDIAGQSAVRTIHEYLFPYVFTSKLWLQRAIWSLTSRQPPSW
jgi:hypothetical protein